MFYTLSVFETPFLWGFDVFCWMFVVPPPEWYDYLILACVSNLPGDQSCMASGTDFELTRM